MEQNFKDEPNKNCDYLISELNVPGISIERAKMLRENIAVISSLYKEKENLTNVSSAITNSPNYISRDSLRDIISRDQKIGIIRVAEYLIDRFSIKTIGKRDNTKEIYIFKDGFYKADYGLIKKEILEITQDIISSHAREEIFKFIKDKTWIESDSFDTDNNLINLKNGVYNIKDGILLQHDPKYLFLHQIDVVYKVNANCPKFKEFVNQILDKDSVEIIQELFGYCLYRSHFIKKAFIFLGEKDTGKTTLIRVLIRFISEKNISGVSLQKLVSDKFAISNLFHKHLNVYDDLSFKDVGDNGMFKILTGNGFVNGEKKFGDQFTFKNFAKLIFACNKMPNVKDTDDEAFFGRWIILRFESKPEKIDKFLFEKISTEEEMSGIFNFAIQGLTQLINKQDFSHSQTPEAIKKDMNMSASSLAQFAYEELEAVSDPNQYISKDVMAQIYIEYVSRRNLPVMSKESIGKKLSKFIAISDGKRSIFNNETGKMKQESCWIGVRFKNRNIEPVAKEEPPKDDSFDFGPF